MKTDTFEINRERAIDYLNTRDLVYVFDGFAGVCVSFKDLSSGNASAEHLLLVGPQVPHQGPRRLCPGVPCTLHEQYAHSTNA